MQLAAVTQLLHHLGKIAALDWCLRPQQGVMTIGLVDPLGHHHPRTGLRVAAQHLDQVGAGHQGNIRTTAQHHQQIAFVGIGQGCRKRFGKVLGCRVEPGKGVVIAAEQRKALAAQIIKIALLTIRLLAGNKHFSVFQPHINGNVRERLPAPGRVLEHQHVHPPPLEIAHTSRHRTGYQDKSVVVLQLVEGIEQLRQQAGVDAAFGAYGIRRKMRSTHPYFLGAPHRCQPDHTEGQQQAVGQL